MERQRASILLTGASGFIGRHMIEALQDDYDIFALARRTQAEACVPPHPHLHWFLTDITDDEDLRRTVLEHIRQAHRIDYVIHLASYYDFGDQTPKKIYEETNVAGTRRVLELSRECGIKRFIFASSLVASEFPAPGDLVYEDSPLDAVFPYARSKKKGEELTRAFAAHFPCTIVRLAAVYSDWCEYEPLDHFLCRWLSDRWDACICVGRQGMAIPYIHISCVVNILRAIIARSAQMGPCDTFLVSPDRPTPLSDIFREATRLYFGQPRVPRHLPLPLARAGVVLRDLAGRVRGRRPFERLWMLRYADKAFHADATYTRRTLGWEPKERYRLENRLPYLIANLKSLPDEWHRRNMARRVRVGAGRPILTLVQELHALRQELVDEIHEHLASPEQCDRFPYYQQLEPERLRYFVDRQYGNLFTCIRHGDRSVMIDFAHDLATVRCREGVPVAELCAALAAAGRIITRRLYEDSRVGRLKLLVHDNVDLVIRLAIDEVQDTYEQLAMTESCVTHPLP